MPSFFKNLIQCLTLGVVSLSVTCPTQANINNDLQFHGFYSQAYLLSDGNNFYGDSQRGSFDYSEAAINGTWRATPNLNFAGQILSRDAGSADNGSVKIDFLFADIKAVESDNSGLGFRIGRVRNAYGFYNDTRDVLFTRPTILMPQAVYFEGSGLRELLFASDGAQLYSYWDADENSTSFNLTMGRNSSLSADTINILFGPRAVAFIHKGELRTPIFGQILHSRNGGDTKFALSILDAQIDLHSNLGSFAELNLDASGYVLSAQKNLATWSFTTEYSLITTNFHSSQGSQIQEIEAAYLQAQYRLRPTITLTGRYELSVRDRDRRNETDSHNLVVGARWTPTPNWIVDVNVYGLRGTSGIPAIDNEENMPLNERTEIFGIMLGYRF